MDSLLQDARLAVRSLARSPGFSAAAVLTLALGIGANTAIFTLVKSALIHSLPYADPDRLTHLWATGPDGGVHESSYPDYLDWRTGQRVFEDMGGYVTGITGTLAGSDAAEAVSVGRATASFFTTLGVRPRIGRAFEPADEPSEAADVVLLSDALFARRFGADPGLLGKTIVVNGRPRTVIGVLPRDFQFAPNGGADVWIAIRPSRSESTRRNYWWLNVVARLSPGTSLDQARAAMKTTAARLSQAFPESNSGLSVRVVPLRDQIVGPVRPVLLALGAAVGFVLLIACVNVTNLLLVRGAGRRKDLAIRRALGADRRRLIQPVLVESTLLGLLGGALGVLLSAFAVPALLAAIPERQRALMPYLEGLSADGGVLAFTFAVSVAAGLLLGLGSAPVLSDASLQDDLGRSAPARLGARRRAVLVVAEVALAVVLLAGAGLMVRSTLNLLRQDAGFEPRGLLTARVTAPRRETEAARILSFHDRVLETVRALPGVAGASSVDILPLGGGGGTSRFDVAGQPASPPDRPNEVNDRTVSASYFRDMGIPLREGRTFDARDHRDTPPVVLVNQALARKFFSGSRAAGQRLRFTADAAEPYREIVGVVGDERQGDLATPAEPTLYEPVTQNPSPSFVLVVRTASDPEGLAVPLQAALRLLDRDLLVSEVRPMERVIGDSPAAFSRRYPAIVIGAFAALALFLALLGIHGVLAYSVVQRRRELGIRVAVGAEPGDVVRLVLGEGLGLAARGLLVGLVAALGLTRILSSLLFGVHPADPSTFAAIAAVFLGTALLACFLPARRAARLDPVAALRCE